MPKEIKGPKKYVSRYVPKKVDDRFRVVENLAPLQNEDVVAPNQPPVNKGKSIIVDLSPTPKEYFLGESSRSEGKKLSSDYPSSG